MRNAPAYVIINKMRKEQTRTADMTHVYRPMPRRPVMEEKVRRTPAKLSDLVDNFGLEILLKGSDYDTRKISIQDYKQFFYSYKRR